MILYLHDILESPDELDLLTGRVSTGHFDQLLELLQSDKWNWVGFKEYCALLKNKRLHSSHVCLSFDDASVTLQTQALAKLDKLGRDCALMIPSAPYLGVHIHYLPHQYVEAVFRQQKRDIAEYRPLKKTLKKRARQEGAQVYWNWLAMENVKLHQVEEYMALDQRFSFLSIETLQKMAKLHSLIYHGHFHLPLGDQTVSEVFEDQFLGRHFLGRNLSSFALPYGDLQGHLREEFKEQYEWIFGTEGPYVDDEVVTRYDGRNFLNSNSH